MTTHPISARHRLLRMAQLTFAGAAAIAMVALFNAAQPKTTSPVLGSGAVRLTAVGWCGGFATDENSDRAQQQEQQALQQLQQSMQQAEQQNEAAEQQFEQGMQQAQMDEQQANDP